MRIAVSGVRNSWDTPAMNCERSSGHFHFAIDVAPQQVSAEQRHAQHSNNANK